MADKKRSKQKTENPSGIRMFWLKYSFQIKVVILLGLGLLLLVEKLKIKDYIYMGFAGVIDFVAKVFTKVTNTVSYLISNVEKSDLIGVALILIAFFMVMKRFRSSLLNRDQGLRVCPKCGAAMARVPKLRVHRMISLFLFVKIGHMHCDKCGYHGMRISPRK